MDRTGSRGPGRIRVSACDRAARFRRAAYAGWRTVPAVHTDGTTDVLDGGDLESLLYLSTSPAIIAEKLIRQAISGGSRDSISVVVGIGLQGGELGFYEPRHLNT